MVKYNQSGCLPPEPAMAYQMLNTRQRGSVKKHFLISIRVQTDLMLVAHNDVRVIVQIKLGLEIKHLHSNDFKKPTAAITFKLHVQLIS